jgi:benzodiazapine receptor
MRVKKATWKIYGIWILLVEAVGALSGWLTREGSKIYTATVEKPSLSPPSAVFPIVWGILFALMGIGAARIYMAPPSPERTKSLRLFFIQLAFNFFWSILFFNFQQFGFALLWLIVLWVLILAMILSFRKVDKLAAWLQIPYLLWVTFAAYLNLGVWVLN